MRLTPLLLSLLLPFGSARAASPWTPEPAPVGWSATEASFRLVIREGEPVRVEGSYVFQTPDAQSAVLQLVGPEVVITSLSGPVVANESGVEVALGPDSRRVVQSFTGLYTPSSWGALALHVLPAARTHVEVDAPGLDVEVANAVDGWIPASDALNVTWRPHVEAGEVRENLVMQGQAAHTFRGAEAGLRVESVLRWRVVRGTAPRLTFETNGLEELEVTGEGVKSWRREGGRVLIEPKGPVSGLFTVRVAGRTTLGKDERSVPMPEPIGVLRTDRYVTMYRSDLGELIPTQMPASVPLEALPAWATNLSEGVPLVAWHGPQPVRVLEVSLTGIPGPDTVVTQARYILSTAAEGRAGLRMVLRVRNERRQYLRVLPPAGWRPVVVRVGNQPVSWLSDGAGGIYIPLEKSIETVRGLLSFPVDVEWVARDLPEWGRKGEMALNLPALDAPVQQAEWEVHLPRGYQALRPPPVGGSRVLMATDLRGDVVLEDPEAQAERRARIDTVSSALDNASSAYKTNDFATAQQWLDHARSVDDQNEEVALLQENLDVLTGTSTKNDMASRRVKELAKAKTGGKASQQQIVEKEAELAYRSGDYDKAEAKLEEAIAIATELQQTEQRESVAQTSRISSASQKLTELRSQRANNGDTTAGSIEEELGGLEGGLMGGVAFGAESTGSFGFGISGTGMGGGGAGEGRLGGEVTDGAAYGTDASGEVVQLNERYVVTGDGDFDQRDLEEDIPMAEPEEPAPTPTVADAERVVTGTTLSKDMLARVPASRSYQSVVGGARAAREQKPADRNDDEGVPESKKKASKAEGTKSRPLPVLAMGKPPPEPAAEAPPPPPPPPAPRPAASSPAFAAPAQPPATIALGTLGYLAAEKSVADAGVEWEEPPAAAEADEAPPPDVAGPTSGSARPLPERRAALQASPSPMALALPLDGPTLTTTQALLPAGEKPEFRFRYRSTLKESP